MTIAQTQRPGRNRPAHIPAPIAAPARAIVTPLTATVYQVSRGDHILGFIESAGTLWIALRGSAYGWAVEIGQFHELEPALRELDQTTDETIDEIPAALEVG